VTTLAFDIEQTQGRWRPVLRIVVDGAPHRRWFIATYETKEAAEDEARWLVARFMEAARAAATT
jgi:uncharacterized protein YegL